MEVTIDHIAHRDNSPPQSDISSTTDDVSYLEKYTHIRAIVVKLEKDLQQLRIKYRALETMQELFKENEAQNNKLRRDKMDLESAISVLQSRLASFGHSTSITFDENDVFLPGPDKDVIKELSKENAKLRQSLKCATVDPSHMDNLIIENRKLKEERDSQEFEYESMKDELQLLQKTFLSSADEKNLKIVQLQQEMEQLNKSRGTSELLCHSLSLESASLKHKLQEMAAACQTLVKQRKAPEMPYKDIDSQSELKLLSSSNLSSDNSSQLFELRSENTKLQMDLMTISQKLKDAGDTNQRWQKFSDQREEYVKHLIKENEELKQSSKKSLGSAAVGKHEPATKTDLSNLKEEKERVEEQNRTLRIQLQNHKDIIARMKEQISVPVENSVNEYTERINMLEHQVRICAEDFETERKDREKAQKRVMQLDRELKSVHDQLHRHQVSEMNKMHYERQVALQKYQEEEQRRLKQPHLVARGFATSGEPDHYDGSRIPPTKKPDAQRDDTLQCPRCMKSFPSDRHNELLEHMDNCVD